MDASLATAVNVYKKQTKTLLYGTAGFRDRHDLPLHSAFVRMGILASLRSLSMGSKCVGVMITASHNPEQDNGVKIVDFDGGMLSQSWEPYAETLANVDADDFVKSVHEIARAESIDLSDTSNRPVVIVGRDTRFHSLSLSNCVEDGIAAMKGICHQLGEVITPQLHFIVNLVNRTIPSPALHVDTGKCLLTYCEQMCSGYTDLLRTAGSTEQSSKKISRIAVDASYGVGTLAVKSFNAAMQTVASPPPLVVEIRNCNGEGKVNEGCGAELVQKNQVPPKSVNAAEDAGKLMCSYDGDGDRIIFHGFETAQPESWIMLDGDKIAALITTFLYNELVAAGLHDHFTLGIVQTAYANGASTAFLSKQGIHTCVAKTGVKFVHHRALEFDVGVYFEANGHGTVLFSDRITASIRSVESAEVEAQQGGDERKRLAFTRLQACLKLINQTVGDALSDMLLCLASLQILGMDMLDWHNMYTDLPSSQVKVCVPDKSRLTCSEDETRVITPVAMQADLDAAMASVSCGRCFVRPSGTEDVVRIYAEAATQEEAMALSNLTRLAIEKHLY